MNQLEKWHQDGVIQIQMAESAQKEAARGSSGRARKAHSYIFTQTMSRTPEESQLLTQIESIVFPGGASSENDRNDVEIVFNALKYGCGLVTNDGGSRRQPRGILGSRDALRSLGARVFTDEEAVDFVRQLIRDRDNLERERHQETGEPIPAWAGRD